MRTGGRWFDTRLGQYSFRELMMLIATGFITPSLLSIVLTMDMWEGSQWFGKNIEQKFVLGSVENIVGKGKNAGISIFSFYLNVFKSPLFLKVVKSLDCVEKAEIDVQTVSQSMQAEPS